MREALVVGYGSIGRRHASILANLGLQVSVVSRRDVIPDPIARFKSMNEALSAASYNYVVLATETAAHIADVQKLASSGYSGGVLVEKPLFMQPAALPTTSAMSIYVGYQLRFHPVVQALRDLIAEEDCVAADFYVGQHLDLWRVDRDSRETYSSKAMMGGGALRDLSHELDLAIWLFGACDRVTAIGGRMSELTVDSDDVWGILGKFKRCPLVTLQLNYLDRIGQRTMTIITRKRTIRVDLVAGTLACDGVTREFKTGRDEPIDAMHRAIIDGGGEDVCSGEDGLQVVEMIAAVERAARSGEWTVV